MGCGGEGGERVALPLSASACFTCERTGLRPNGPACTQAGSQEQSKIVLESGYVLAARALQQPAQELDAAEGWQLGSTRTTAAVP